MALVISGSESGSWQENQSSNSGAQTALSQVLSNCVVKTLDNSDETLQMMLSLGSR